ncbi:MAG: putative membrane protein, partial [Polyangiales bacterium]
MVSRDKSHRLAAIDLLRGAVMVLMVLDHTRDFFMVQEVRATDLANTNAPLFFTRWVTHFCAPGFVFLAGTAIFLAAQRRSAHERTRFLLTRGFFLVVLELTVVKFGWAPEPFYYFVLLQVIWAIGWSMVAMAGLSFLPSRLVGGLGVLALALAPLWENASGTGAVGVALTLLTGTGVYQ